MRRWFYCVPAIGLALLTGCASVRDADPVKAGTLTPGYDQRDLLSWTDEMARLILADFPPEGETRPIVAPLGIQNRTKTHLDTQALLDTIGMKLLESGEVLLVNTARRDDLLKEQGYQLANATPETRAQVGRQLGAKYMLTGSIIEIEQEGAREIRLRRAQDIYYQLTLEMTDLETGLVVLRKQVDRMRRQKVPIIGW